MDFDFDLECDFDFDLDFVLLRLPFDSINFLNNSLIGGGFGFYAGVYIFFYFNLSFCGDLDEVLVLD